MANLVDNLTQFTADFLKFTAAETRYYEFVGRGGAEAVAGGGAVAVNNGSASARAPSPPPSKPLILQKAQESTKPLQTVLVNGNDNGESNSTKASGGLGALSQQIAYAREQIASSLRTIPSSIPSGGVEPSETDAMIREENLRLKQQLEQLQAQVNKLTDRVSKLETRLSEGGSGDAKMPAAAPATKKADDDDVDLFGSDEEEDAEAAKIKEQRLAEYAAKKSKKTAVIAKSNVILDIKPWDDETDMKELEKCVRSVEMDGLLWGTSKLVPLAYGIKKLQISTVVEDEKVSVDELSEKIQEFEDFVQSVDIAAFNKI